MSGAASEPDLSCFFKMAASRFVELTDEEINCLRETAYFSNNHQHNYTKTIICLRLGEYR